MSQIGPAARPGWYRDPNNPAQERYWGGVAWSDNYRPVPPPPQATPVGDEPESDVVTIGYITAVILPIVGFVLGIVAVTRPARATSKHGAPIIVLSIVAFVVWYAVLSY